ncbi:MAG: hercynine metabolism protein [Cyanobium sp.]
MSSPSDWFSQLERQLEQQLESFLRANPAQEQLLRQQEQRERLQRLRRRRLDLQASAERARADLLKLAGEIRQWQERVQRARAAGADALAQRAEAHMAELMARGRDRWQALGQLGDDYRQVEQELEDLSDGRSTGGASEAGSGPAATSSAAENAATENLEQAWSRFESEQDLEQLRRRQAGG